ncbi:MAG TPA: phosphoribosyltransferase family protein [Edaphocola sp.]|nr:phosphoribosyltransferase family protein [Edaphocola sp.]
MNKIALLNSRQIEQKLKRMAYEIWEQNHNEKEIFIVGIAEAGYILAQNLLRHLEIISPLKIHLHKMVMDKAHPEKNEDLAIGNSLKAKPVVLVDDVANSGKTLMYALAPLLKQQPSKIEIAVLVNRHHKNFPIAPDIIGQSVSTTLQDHITVTFKDNQLTGAYLE